MTSVTRRLFASASFASVVAAISLAAADASLFEGRPVFKEGHDLTPSASSRTRTMTSTGSISR